MTPGWHSAYIVKRRVLACQSTQPLTTPNEGLVSGAAVASSNDQDGREAEARIRRLREA